MINVELNSSILDISKQQPLVSEIDLEIGSNQFSFSDLLKGLQYKQKSLLSDGFDVNKDKLQSFNDKKEEQNNSLENFLLKDENKTSKNYSFRFVKYSKSGYIESKRFKAIFS